MISSGIESFVGTPFVRNSLSQEVKLAFMLFKAGLPLWEVVHIINTNSQYIGLDTCGLIIRGNPLIKIERAMSIKYVDPVFDKKGSMLINIPGAEQVTRLICSSNVCLDSIVSETKDHQFLYATAPRFTNSKNEVWIAGKGSARILLNNNRHAIKVGLNRELKADIAWKKIETFIPLTAKESGLRKRWIDLASNAQNLRLPASIDSSVAMKMEQRIRDTTKARQQLESVFVERLTKQLKKKTPRCPIDLSRTRLIFTKKTEKAICPACNHQAIKIHFEYSWETLRCPRCGVVSLNNGTRLIKAIQFPIPIVSGEKIDFTIEVNCETYSAGIYRGDHEGFTLKKRSMNNWILQVNKDTPPHFYYLRIYAIHKGLFEAAHRIIEVF